MSGDFGKQQFQRQQFKHKPSDVAKAGVDHDAIREKLKIPAKGLFLTGLLSVVIVIAGTVGGLVYGSTQKDEIVYELMYRMYGPVDEDTNLDPQRRRNSKKEKEAQELKESRARTVMTLALGGVIIGSLVLSSFYIFAVSGGILMGQLRNYNVCRLACILALIPVISPLVVVGIPFGIIGLAKLASPDVKKAFT